MAEPITVTIDVEQLRGNFTASEGREWTADDVMEFLRECGFRYQGRTWLCRGQMPILSRSSERDVLL